MSIIGTKEGLANKSGNVLVSGEPFSARWLDKNTVEVTGNTGHNFKMEKRRHGVDILYRLSGE